MRCCRLLLLLALLLPSAAGAGYNAASGAWDFNGTCTPATSCTVGDVLTVTDTGHAIFQAPSGGGGSGDITAVGNCATGAAFTDAASCGSVLSYEGATVNANETHLAFTGDPSADFTVTIPNETGTICTTGSVCSGYGDITSVGICTSGGCTAYQSIQDNGSPEISRFVLNLIGTGVSCVDNVPSAQTDCTFTSGGTITGPGSSTDNAIARWSGTTGTILKNSFITISDAGIMQTATLNYYNNLYGRDVEPYRITDWSAEGYRFRAGGTTATTGDQVWVVGKGTSTGPYSYCTAAGNPWSCCTGAGAGASCGTGWAGAKINLTGDRVPWSTLAKPVLDVHQSILIRPLVSSFTQPRSPEPSTREALRIVGGVSDATIQTGTDGGGQFAFAYNTHLADDGSASTFLTADHAVRWKMSVAAAGDALSIDTVNSAGTVGATVPFLTRFSVRHDGRIGMGITPATLERLAINIGAAADAGLRITGVRGETWFPFSDGQIYLTTDAQSSGVGAVRFRSVTGGSGTTYTGEWMIARPIAPASGTKEGVLELSTLGAGMSAVTATTNYAALGVVTSGGKESLAFRNDSAETWVALDHSDQHSALGVDPVAYQAIYAQPTGGGAVTSFPSRLILYFPSGVTCADNAGAARTECTVAGGGISGSGTDNNIVRWDGTSNVQNSGVSVSDLNQIFHNVTQTASGTSIPGNWLTFNYNATSSSPTLEIAQVVTAGIGSGVSWTGTHAGIVGAGITARSQGAGSGELALLRGGFFQALDQGSNTTVTTELNALQAYVSDERTASFATQMIGLRVTRNKTHTRTGGSAYGIFIPEMIGTGATAFDNIWAIYAQNLSEGTYFGGRLDVGGHVTTAHLSPAVSLGNFATAGAVVRFRAEEGEKIAYYPGSFGVGIEPSLLSHWTSSGSFRWKYGGSSAVTSTQIADLNATGFKHGGTLGATASFHAVREGIQLLLADPTASETYYTTFKAWDSSSLSLMDIDPMNGAEARIRLFVNTRPTNATYLDIYDGTGSFGLAHRLGGRASTISHLAALTGQQLGIGTAAPTAGMRMDVVGDVQISDDGDTLAPIVLDNRAGGRIQFQNDVGDKLLFYGNVYGMGVVEAGALTLWGQTKMRLRLGATTACGAATGAGCGNSMVTITTTGMALNTVGTDPVQMLDVEGLIGAWVTDTPGTCNAANKGTLYYDDSLEYHCFCRETGATNCSTAGTGTFRWCPVGDPAFAGSC